MENFKKATATTTWMVPTAQEGKSGPSALSFLFFFFWRVFNVRLRFYNNRLNFENPG